MGFGEGGHWRWDYTFWYLCLQKPFLGTREISKVVRLLFFLVGGGYATVSDLVSNPETKFQILVSDQGLNPCPLASEGWSLNH